MENITFNSHQKHNPNCDILQAQLDSDSILTYGIYVSGHQKGKQFCEYYSGRNYVPGSSKKSYSKCWLLGKIPLKYFKIWMELKNKYVTQYINK